MNINEGKERNALAELAAKLEADRNIFRAFRKDLGSKRHEVGGMVDNDLCKAIRIITELANVGFLKTADGKHVAHPGDACCAVEKCRAIAEEGWRTIRTNDRKDSVCSDCATRMGYEPDDKPVGVWVDRCDFCGKRKPLTSLSNDWHKKGAKW